MGHGTNRLSFGDGFGTGPVPELDASTANTGEKSEGRGMSIRLFILNIMIVTSSFRCQLQPITGAAQWKCMAIKVGAEARMWRYYSRGRV